MLSLSCRPKSYQIYFFLKFVETWGKLEAKICFQRQSWAKYLRKVLVFMRNRALRQKFTFLFFRKFLLVLKYFSFREKDWTLDYNSMIFDLSLEINCDVSGISVTKGKIIFMKRIKVPTTLHIENYLSTLSILTLYFYMSHSGFRVNLLFAVT